MTKLDIIKKLTLEGKNKKELIIKEEAIKVIRDIDRKIENAARDGESHVRIDLHSYEGIFTWPAEGFNYIVENYREEGFQAFIVCEVMNIQWG